MAHLLIDERNRQIGENIRKYRILKGLTNDDLCQDICSPAQLSKIENGKTYAQRDILKQFAQRLNISVGRLESQDGLKDEMVDMFQAAKNFMNINDFNSALPILESLLERAKEFDYTDILVESYVLLSRSLILTGQYTKAIFKLHDLIKTEKYFDDAKYPMLLYYLGYAYQFNGDMAIAHDFYMRAYETIETRDTQISIEDHLQLVYAVAQSHGNLKYNRIALRYAEKAEDLASKTSMHLLKIRSRYMRGTLLRRLGEYKQAEEILLSSLTEAERNEFILDSAIINHNLGELYQDVRDFPKASIHLERARFLFHLLNDTDRHITTILQIAELFIVIPDLTQCVNMIDKALSMLDKLDSDIYLNRPRALRIYAKVHLIKDMFDQYSYALVEAMTIYVSNKYYNDAYDIAAELAVECDKRNDPKTLDMYRKAIEYNELITKSGMRR